MATTSNKRSSRAKRTAKPAETKTEQPSVEEPKAAPQSVAESEIGESAVTPAATVASAVEPPAAPDTGPLEQMTGDQSAGDTPVVETVSGDGSGEALPPVDPDAGERTAEGVSDDVQGNDAIVAVQDEIPALFIRTRKATPRRRRCGQVFTPEGHGIALSGLSAEQIEAFESDPTLIVEECSFPAEPDETSDLVSGALD
jgi:hypothetical protein